MLTTLALFLAIACIVLAVGLLLMAQRQGDYVTALVLPLIATLLLTALGATLYILPRP